jgi:hypothetical protein
VGRASALVRFQEFCLELSRMIESAETRRWREMDSNHGFLVRRSRILLRKANCGGRGVDAVRADIDDPTLPLPPSFNLWSGSAGVRTRTDASWSAVEPRPT